jgi:hypothetical protein
MRRLDAAVFVWSGTNFCSLPKNRLCRQRSRDCSHPPSSPPASDIAYLLSSSDRDRVREPVLILRVVRRPMMVARSRSCAVRAGDPKCRKRNSSLRRRHEQRLHAIGQAVSLTSIISYRSRLSIPLRTMPSRKFPARVFVLAWSDSCTHQRHLYFCRPATIYDEEMREMPPSPCQHTSCLPKTNHTGLHSEAKAVCLGESTPS